MHHRGRGGIWSARRLIPETGIFPRQQALRRTASGRRTGKVHTPNVAFGFQRFDARLVLPRSEMPVPYHPERSFRLSPLQSNRLSGKQLRAQTSEAPANRADVNRVGQLQSRRFVGRLAHPHAQRQDHLGPRTTLYSLRHGVHATSGATSKTSYRSYRAAHGLPASCGFPGILVQSKFDPHNPAGPGPRCFEPAHLRNWRLIP